MMLKISIFHSFISVGYLPIVIVTDQSLSSLIIYSIVLKTLFGVLFCFVVLHTNGLYCLQPEVEEEGIGPLGSWGGCRESVAVLGQFKTP